MFLKDSLICVLRDSTLLGRVDGLALPVIVYC
jgi:hypothetical protein